MDRSELINKIRDHIVESFNVVTDGMLSIEIDSTIGEICNSIYGLDRDCIKTDIEYRVINKTRYDIDTAIPICKTNKEQIEANIDLDHHFDMSRTGYGMSIIDTKGGLHVDPKIYIDPNNPYGEPIKITKGGNTLIGIDPASSNFDHLEAGIKPNLIIMDDPFAEGVIKVKDENLPNPMFLIGNVYKQISGDNVLIVGMYNQNTSFETVYSINYEGKPIHRYNRRDFGRVSGTAQLDPSSDDLKPLK